MTSWNSARLELPFVGRPAAGDDLALDGIHGGVASVGSLGSLPVCLGTRDYPDSRSYSKNLFRLRRPGRPKAVNRGHPANAAHRWTSETSDCRRTLEPDRITHRQ